MAKTSRTKSSLVRAIGAEAVAMAFRPAALPNLSLKLLAAALVVLALAACSTAGSHDPGADATVRLALVALVDDPETRAAFEDGLAAKLQAANYDAVPSYGIVSDPAEFDDADFMSRLAAAGVEGLVMMRPAAVGPGSSLESVRNEIPANVYSDMRAFARETSPGGSDELVAVVHTAFYMLNGRNADLLSSGAVWLDRPPKSREEGLAALQDLIVNNMNRARPAVREYLGLPPL